MNDHINNPAENLSAIPIQHLASPELYPGYAAELAKKQRRDQAIVQANAEPFPGPLLDAFAGLPQTIGGLTVRPLVHFDFLLLRLLNSPILQHMVKEQGEGPTKTEMLEEQVYDLCLLFTMPCREAAAIIQKPDGPEAFREASIDRIGLSLSPLHVTLLLKAVEREFARAFSTVVGLKPASVAAEEEGKQVFTQPPADQRTGSVGGSITTAPSSKGFQDGPMITSSSNCPGSKAEPSIPGAQLNQ